MKRFSIQARLTAWYFLSTAAIVALFAAGSWFALRVSMYHSIDRDLAYRMQAVVPFIQSHALNSRQQFQKAFAGTSDASIVGVFVQITDEQSNVVYESDVLRSHHVPLMPTGSPDGSISLSTFGSRGWPVRVASQHLVVAGTGLTVHVVEPLRDLLNSLREYSFYFAALIPLALLLTSTLGYWMSRRALAPVEHIRKDAAAIDSKDLATRLKVPETEDELTRLAQTLNDMLSRIESSFRSVEQFTADASHELRAPLAMIITAGEVSLRHERSRDELTEVLRKIVREARHMSRLVDDLLSLARADAQPVAAHLEPVDLAPILQGLCAEMEPIAAGKGIALTSRIPDARVAVSGESVALRRLFLILMDNAIKYTESGSVAVTLESDDAHAIVTVHDTGIGMEESALPHVFDRFWRADKVRSRAAGGSGLGLSLASQVVRRHNGTITVSSELGHGSTFTVRLPSAEVS